MGESHISSAIGAVDVVKSIYDMMQEGDKFILSAGHAGMAQYVNLGMTDREIEQEQLHPVRDEKKGIWASTGSLGHGLPIALGMALAKPDTNYFVLMSDGECMEGSVWEALRLATLSGVRNLAVFVYANGWGGYDPINIEYLKNMLDGFGFPVVIVKVDTDFEGAKNLDSHYHILTKEEYQKNIR